MGALAIILTLLLSGAVYAAPKQALLQDAATATGNGTAMNTSGVTSVALQVTISDTATVTFEGSVDGGTWASVSCISSTGSSRVQTATATGLYQCNVAGILSFRARISAYSAGTVTVTAVGTDATFASGAGGVDLTGLTDGCLLYDNSDALGCSPLTTDGTDVTNSGGYIAKQGSAGSPSYGFSNDAQLGWYAQDTNQLVLSDGNGNPAIILGNAQFSMKSSTLVGWTSSSTSSLVARDVHMERLGAGNLMLSNTSASDVFLDIRNDDDASNYEGIQIGIDATNNDAEITAITAGTGDDNQNLAFQTAGTGYYKYRNGAEGGAGSLDLKMAREVHTLAAAATSDTTFNIPATSMILGCTFNVDTAVTDSAGDDTWSAQMYDGALIGNVLASGAAAAQNTKANAFMSSAQYTDATTNVQFSPNGGNFTAGVIETICWYYDLTDLGNA